MATSLIHTAARVLLPSGLAEPGWVDLDGDGHVLRSGSGEPPRPADVRHPAGMLVPGLVDLHCHGGGGVFFADGVTEAQAALAVHRASGTTACMASLATAPLADLERQCAQLAPLVTAGDLAGVHLEGPWLSPARRGAHDPALLKLPTRADAATLLSAAAGTLRMVTIAPELPGALAVIEMLVEHGVIVALGHSEADEATTRSAIAAGASVATHLFNAMPPLLHRDPGLAGALLDSPGVTVELIADGVHVAPAMLRLAARAAVGGFALVTDAIAAAGQGDGDYRLGPLAVEVRGGTARLAGTQTLAGSTLVLSRALRYAATVAALPLLDVLRAATERPAALLGRTDVGHLGPGARGGVVVLDDTLRVVEVIAPGGPRGIDVPPQ